MKQTAKHVPIEVFLSEWQGVILSERAPPLKRIYIPRLSELPPPEPLSLYKPPPEPLKIPLSIEITKPSVMILQEKPKLEEEKIILPAEQTVSGVGQEFGTDFETSKATFRLLGEGDKLFDIITGFSLDGSINYSESWVEYKYDDRGLLTNSSGAGKTWGEDVFGNAYFTQNTDTYRIINGQARRVAVLSVTEGTNLDGSVTRTQGDVSYEYTDGTEDPATLPSEYIGDKGEVLIGLLRDVQGTSATTGQDVFGNAYTTATTDEYIVIKGEAKVQSSHSITDSMGIDGSIVKTTADIAYEYTDGTEDPASLPAEYIKDGKVIIGLIKDVRGENVTEGEDVFGNKYITTTKDIYEVIGGRAKVLDSESETYYTSIDGGLVTTKGGVTYKYSTQEKPYINPVNNRKGIGVVIGADGQNITTGEDVFGNKYTTTTTNTYVAINGQAKVDVSTSVTDGTNLDGSINHVESVVKYNYTDGTEDPAALPLEYSKEGKVFKGLLKSASGSSETTAEDVFGNSSVTKTDNTYIYKKGQAFVERADTVTTGQDIMGTAYTTKSYIKYIYGPLKAGEKGALRNADFIAIGAEGGAETDSEDLFGNKYHSSSTNKYVYNKGQNYVDRVDTVNTGMDMNGNVYTTKGFITYIYGPLKAGEKGALRDASFILLDAYGENDTQGKDIFGNPYHTLAKNTYTYFKGQVYVARVDSDTVSEDMFGNIITTHSFVNYKYGSLKQGEKGALRDSQFVLLDAEGGATSIGTDITGGSYTTTSVDTYEFYKGQVFVKQNNSVTEGKDLFGTPYKNLTTTINEYSEVTGNTGRKGYLIVKSYITTTTSGEDLFGNKFETQDLDSNPDNGLSGTQKIEYVYGALKSDVPGLIYIWGIASAIEKSPAIIKGSDIFGNTYVNKTETKEFIYYRGKAFAKETISTVEGYNLFSSPYSNTTKTINEYALVEGLKDRFGYLVTKATNTTSSTSEDIFGNPVITEKPQVLEYIYGEATSPANKKIWGIVSAEEKNPLVTKGSDIFGNEYKTTTKSLSFEYLYGRALVKSAETTTTGTNLFGCPYSQTTFTVNTNALYTNRDNNRQAILTLSSTTTVTKYEAEDIFGNKVNLI
ncbi:MAG: hypothetical protein NTX47_02755, partial [Candidatus Omnitrophica bacterium]|nr:hypothetical protein [Candidatus Omnitrophota bacterium]